VLDGHGSLVGILTQRDCLQVGLHGIYHQEPAGRVNDYMSQPVETVSADATLPDLIEKFRASPHRCFPVMDGTRVIGQLSRRDILRAILELW
jgi:CBS domain-containing protein